MPVLADAITDALAKIGQAGIGQSISQEQMQQGLRESQRQMGNWAVRRLMLYTIATRPFNLSAGVQDYTLGPTGATFTGARPTLVEGAVAVVPGTTNELEVSILDIVKWGAIRDKGTTSSAAGTPLYVWPEPTYPNLTFHVWPIPATIVVLKLKTWEQIQQFATVFDTLLFPPGYEEPFVDNLAIRLCPYYDKPVPDSLAQSAAQGLIDIQTLNAQTIGGSLGSSAILSAPSLDVPAPARGGSQ